MKLHRLAAVAVLSCLFAGFSPAFAGADIGDAASLSGKDIAGHPFDLAQMRGKVVIVNFWATWCAPCRAEMPMLDKFYLDHRGQGVVLIGISEDKPRAGDDVKDAMASLHYPAAMMSDLDQDSFGRPHELPVTYVADASGVVRVALQPQDTPLSEARLSAAVTPLLPAAK